MKRKNEFTKAEMAWFRANLVVLPKRVRVNFSRFHFTKAELDKFHKMIDAWTSPDADKELKQVYKEDREELYTVLRFRREGKLNAAVATVNQLDSIIRDQIPKTIYDKLYPDEGSVDGRFIHNWRITLRDGEEIETHMSLQGIEAQYGDKLEKLEKMRWVTT